MFSTDSKAPPLAREIAALGADLRAGRITADAFRAAMAKLRASSDETTYETAKLLSAKFGGAR